MWYCFCLTKFCGLDKLKNFYYMFFLFFFLVGFDRCLKGCFFFFRSVILLVLFDKVVA